MRGSNTLHSHLKRLVALASLGATAASITWFTSPATADTFSEYLKQRQHIEQRSRLGLGAPYRYGGTSLAGFDCSGLTRWVFYRHGALLPHNALQQFKLANRPGDVRIWKRKNLRKGDLVFFDTTVGRVGHVGIYIGRGRFISTTSSRGVRVQSVWDRYYWGRRWVGATRLRITRPD